MVKGGLASIVAALDGTLGLDGLLLIPSFSLIDFDERPEVLDAEKTPSIVGGLTEF